MTDPYITVEEADELAADELDSGTWDALSAGQQLAALVQASDEIDAVTWQGYRAADGQQRAFPRVGRSVPGDDGEMALVYWDWSDDDNEAVVPESVKKACYLQAVSLAEGMRAHRLDDRHDGVASQSAGGLSESYNPNRPPRPLCRRAWLMVRRYALRTGRIA